MSSVVATAPAKINLRLKVVGKRPDGYHLLSMLNEKLTLADRIHVTATGQTQKYSDRFPIDIICKENRSLETESNLVCRAARALARKYDLCSSLKIEIEKVIPMGGGLGGGSSDAASVLLALNSMWNLGNSPEELAEVGVTIGADVPFFLFDGPCRVAGIGEEVKPYVRLPKLWVLLISPGFEISTGAVYESIDLELTQNREDVSFPAYFNNLDDLCGFIENDLEKVVSKRHPEIEEVKGYLVGRGARTAFMTGSGSTVAGLFESSDKRDNAILGSRPDGWKFFSTENMQPRR